MANLPKQGTEIQIVARRLTNRALSVRLENIAQNRRRYQKHAEE